MGSYDFADEVKGESGTEGLDTALESVFILDPGLVFGLRQTVFALCEELLDDVEPVGEDGMNQTDIASEIVTIIGMLEADDHDFLLFWYPLALAYVYLDKPAARINSIVDTGIQELTTAIADRRDRQTLETDDAEMAELYALLDDREALAGLRQSAAPARIAA
jgi:hypothetical protein